MIAWERMLQCVLRRNKCLETQRMKLKRCECLYVAFL